MLQKIVPFLPAFFLFSCDFESAEEKYDRETGQQPVLTHEGIDAVLDDFEVVEYKELSTGYKDTTDPDKKFRDKLADTEYRVVKGKDMFRFIVGKTRIQNFLCTDQYYIDNEDHLEENRKQYWLIDPKLLHWILDFMLALEEKGYDKYGFYVRESHRHPHFNVNRGGASQSQHIYGRAADLVMQDLNQDGEEDQRDKEIGLEILEGIVGNKGGMGLYPGTMTIHIDTRGYPARWNQQ